jgi:hypothetical protein
MDGNCRDELLSRMSANKIESRLQGALMEMLYPLIELGDMALSFTYPSLPIPRVPDRSDLEVGDRVRLGEGVGLLPGEDRAELLHEYETRLHMVAQGKGGQLAF